MKELSEPVEVCLQRLDMIYVRQYAQASGSSVAATIRDLCHEAIVARDQRNSPPVLRLSGLNTPNSEFTTGPEGKKGVASERVGPQGKSGRKMDTIPQTIAERDERDRRKKSSKRTKGRSARVPDSPMTPPEYTITHVSHTEEEEI